MKLRCEWLLLALGICATLAGSSRCDAQWRILNQPIQKPLRLMGQGWSGGYHWRNPGHDSSYYNPYSHHNSHLKSQWDPSVSQNLAPNADIFAPPGAGWNAPLPVIEAEFRPEAKAESQSEKPDTLPNSSEAKPRNPAPLTRDKIQPQRKDSRLEREGLENNDWPFPID